MQPNHFQKVTLMLTLRSIPTVALALLLTVQPALAWSECGHHIIAVMAFDLMKPADQQRIQQLLKHHPRFGEDFAAPNNTMDADQLAHWVVGRAGYWPDVARSQPTFNRPNWHYQLGASVIIGDAVEIPETPGALPAGADLSTKDLHIAQAIELCRQTLRSDAAPESDKAIAICWLAHLVADAHQPCHAGSLYAESVFPEGDRGANSISTRQGRNLHALWDGLLGNKYDAGDIARRVKEIRSDKLSWAAAEAAGKTQDPLQWLTESSGFAASQVYSQQILDAVDAAQRIGTDKIETVDLPESYLKAAGALAQKRAAFAAHRLAAILSEDLKE